MLNADDVSSVKHMRILAYTRLEIAKMYNFFYELPVNLHM